MSSGCFLTWHSDGQKPVVVQYHRHVMIFVDIVICVNPLPYFLFQGGNSDEINDDDNDVIIRSGSC